MAENLSWLAGAFAVGWAIVFGYLFRISRKEQEVRRRVAALEKLLIHREAAYTAVANRVRTGSK